MVAQGAAGRTDGSIVALPGRNDFELGPPRVFGRGGN